MHPRCQIGLSSVLRPRQHSIGYMGDGFHRSEDPTNSIIVLKEQITRPDNVMQSWVICRLSIVCPRVHKVQLLSLTQLLTNLHILLVLLVK